MRKRVLNEPGPLEFFIAGVDAEDLRREVFFLAYHLHWSWTELMDIDTHERRSFVRLLVEQIERENSRMEEAAGR